MDKQNRNILILAIAGFAFVIFISVLGAININYASVYTLVLYAGLIVVTILYAYFTFGVAQASLKMAEEMREQRYGAVRPIIDIVREADGARVLGEAMEGSVGQITDGLLCRICNIGVGPAMDVVTVVMSFSVGSMKKSFGTMGVGDHTEPYLLSIMQGSGRQELCVYYSDIYGNRYQSRREVRITDAGIELGDFEFEPLSHNKELKDKDND